MTILILSLLKPIKGLIENLNGGDVVGDIKLVKDILVNMDYSSANRIIVHSRLEAYVPLMLVQLVEEGVIILMMLGEEAIDMVKE